MMKINLYLIRHGETEANVQNDTIGQEPNAELTSNGINQAGRLGKRFLNRKIISDFIFSSTYKRAMQTAEIFSKIVGFKGSIGLSSDLIEYNPGEWKGKKRADIYSDMKNVQDILNLNMGFVFPEGESYNQVSRRMTSFIEREVIYNKSMLKRAETKDQNIVVFSHGQSIKCLLQSILGFDKGFIHKISINNTSVCHLFYTEQGWFVKSINDTAHLLDDERKL